MSPSPVVSSPPGAPPMWEDLAAHRAGEMARQQAVALKQAAPVRTFVARVFGLHTDERSWRIGADGEEKVAARLAKLAKRDPRWRFVHAIPVGENGSDIDHLVIGPGGVFSLNAKHHPGARIWVRDNAFRVNGQQQPYIRNSRHEARRAGRYLTAACGFPVDVTGIVVPVGADDLTIKQQPADVVVVNRMALAPWLRRRPDLLGEAAVDAIFEAARRSTTWRPQR
ncbi:nuclease-related domain-containing protein [Cellulomonas sp. T2.31MG-18]|uniref:nuclease-related domain-containing protein n=1 Tax=Cellulomonas sp. T2.31MG-18 TaxID=3157619 RepID=UPI00367248AC